MTASRAGSTTRPARAAAGAAGKVVITPARPGSEGGHRRAMADQHQARAGLVQPCAKALAQARFGQQVQPLARLVEQRPGATRQQRAGDAMRRRWLPESRAPSLPSR
jgi:hypothetical protein